MNWDDLRALIVLAETKTFTHAANQLGVSIATLTRKIDRLESHLSVKLFRRGPSGVKATPEAERILEMAIRGGEYMAQVERLATAISSGKWRDPIRVSSTEPVIADILAPRVADFYREHPDIQLDLMVSTDISNLQRQDADLAIRLARPKEPTLMARKLAEVELGLFVSRSVAENQPEGQSWREFAFVSFDGSFGEIPELRWMNARGVRSRVCFMSSSTRAQLSAVRSGLGAAILPTYMAAFDPELVRLEVPPIASRQLWLVFHRDMKNQPAITSVRNWIKQACLQTLTEEHQA